MILVTSPDVPGRTIDRVLGLVRGNTIRGRHMGHDIQAVFRNMAGGEIKEYTKMMAEAREQSIDRMVDEARTLGADAIVALRFQTCEIMKGAAEMLCYGTAVTFSSEE